MDRVVGGGMVRRWRSRMRGASGSVVGVDIFFGRGEVR